MANKSPLPFLPGNTFSDPTKTRYHVAQTLAYRNGYRQMLRPQLSVGSEPLEHNQLSDAELDELAKLNPTLTYGNVSKPAPVEFVPAHVAFDKKVLLFHAFFKQTVHESPNEFYRVRDVRIYYYLEDDSIAVVEPPLENSGIPQGKLIKRQRLPKNDLGDYWHWKDFNLNINVTFYGKVFHIYDCDKWTEEYLTSEGLDLNAPKEKTSDPYIVSRYRPLHAYVTPSEYDKLKQFIELDRKVLRFYSVWDDRDSMFGEMKQYIIHFYLADDTVEIREVHELNDGRDPFPILLCRQKLAKEPGNIPSDFPIIAMETSSQEIKDYFSPKDFMIGKTLYMADRRFFIYDCDEFTRQFYEKKFGVKDIQPVRVTKPPSTSVKRDLPPHNGFGSLEDSEQCCRSLIPQPPRKDYMKMLENDGKVLRYKAIMDSTRPEDKNRTFIISYRLYDEMITIYEPSVRNAGIIGGKFLERTRAVKPRSHPDNPNYYMPQDFAIGSVIEVFKHKFIIIDADEYVLNYMEKRTSKFSPELIEALRNKHKTNNPPAP